MPRLNLLRSTILTLATCALGMSTLLAYAGSDEPQGQKPPTFEEMDQNGDNLLSRDEVKGKLAEDFDKFDRDGDGYLSEGEMPPPPGPRPE